MTRSLTRLCVLVCFCITLISCATTVVTSKLKKPVGREALTLTQDVILPLGNNGADKIIVKAGLYTAEFEDENGVYYRGPAYSLWMILANNSAKDKSYRRNGGFWRANAATATPKFNVYHYYVPMLVENAKGEVSAPISGFNGQTPYYPSGTTAPTSGVTLPTPAPTGRAIGSQAVGGAIAGAIVDSFTSGLDKDIAVIAITVRNSDIEPFLKAGN
jgi:hypothetical protein